MFPVYQQIVHANNNDLQTRKHSRHDELKSICDSVCMNAPLRTNVRCPWGLVTNNKQQGEEPMVIGNAVEQGKILISKSVHICSARRARGMQCVTSNPFLLSLNSEPI